MDHLKWMSAMVARVAQVVQAAVCAAVLADPPMGLQKTERTGLDSGMVQVARVATLPLLAQAVAVGLAALVVMAITVVMRRVVKPMAIYRAGLRVVPAVVGAALILIIILAFGMRKLNSTLTHPAQLPWAVVAAAVVVGR